MTSAFFMNEQLSDVTLKVRYAGYTWRFPVHSLILNARSSKFRELLEERTSDETPVPITIVGTPPDTILAILRYIYTGECPTNVSADLLVAASKYRLKSLQSELEQKLLPNLKVPQACQLLEEFDMQEPVAADTLVKTACLNMIEFHAYRVFASDLVFTLSRKNLAQLMPSERLNIPDEAVLFWGLWRWGRRYCSQNARPITNESVAEYLEDLLKLIRLSNLKNRAGIPAVALKSFNRCLCPRVEYEPPEDSLEQSKSLRTCRMWDDLVEVGNEDEEEDENLCLQVSFDKDVMLVGMTVEICGNLKKEIHLQIFRESDHGELWRQRINCFRCNHRKLSGSAQQPEVWSTVELVLQEPLILNRREIYAVYLRTSESRCHLPKIQIEKRRIEVEGGTVATLHGQSVLAVQELHLVADLQATWGPSRSHESDE